MFSLVLQFFIYNNFLEIGEIMLPDNYANK